MTGDFGSTISSAWQSLLDLIAKVVSPDWGALVALIPLLIAPLVLLLLFLVVARWTLYALRRPRSRVRFVDGPTALERDDSGSLVVPIGQPFSLVTGLAYPYGTARTDDGRDLDVICPMCQVQRPAALPTCGNCGLILNVRRSIQVARPAGPPPGGAASA